MATPAFIYAFDNLGPDHFTELCGHLLGSRCKGFLLGGVGADGGIDGEVDERLGEWHPESLSPLLNNLIRPGQLAIFQFKHKVTARTTQVQARSQLLDLYKCLPSTKCELHRALVLKKKPAMYVLVTNVEVNANFREKFIEHCRQENPKIKHYQVIGLDELEMWVKMDPTISHLYFPTIFGPPRFDLRVELTPALPMYHQDQFGDRLGPLLCVKVMNIGTAPSYVRSIFINVITDGRQNRHQLIWHYDPILAQINPKAGTPLEPGRCLEYFYQLSDFSQLKSVGNQVFPVEIQVEDEIDNVYRAEISPNLREMMGFDG